jgi:hypothetical protein
LRLFSSRIGGGVKPFGDTGAGCLANREMAGAFLFVALSIRFVRFITKADDMCDELDIDLTFPAEENHANRTTQTGPVAEGAAAAA